MLPMVMIILELYYGGAHDSDGEAVLTKPADISVSATESNTSITFTITDNDNPTGNSLHYEIDYSTDQSILITNTITGTSVTVTGLSTGTIYYYRARARNTRPTGSSTTHWYSDYTTTANIETGNVVIITLLHLQLVIGRKV